MMLFAHAIAGRISRRWRQPLLLAAALYRYFAAGRRARATRPLDTI